MAKFWILSLVFLVLAGKLSAAAYYVTQGAAGTGSLVAPFGTVQQGVNALRPGDTLYIRQGVYQGTVRISTAGSSASPINIKAYPGECPVLAGVQPLGPWNAATGSIYWSPWSTQPQQVFCDGRMLNEARWPAAGVEALSSQPVAISDWGSATAEACAALPAALPGVDLTGALIQDMPGQSWTSYTRTIASYGPVAGTLAFDTPINAVAALVPRRGDRFYVFGALALLRAAGEWYWDPVAQRLYVWTPAGDQPAGHRMEAGTAGPLLILDNQAYISVSGLSAYGGWFSLHNSSNCVIQDCHLSAPCWNRLRNGYSTPVQGGVDISGTDNQWLGGSIVFAGSSAVNIIGGSGNVVNGLVAQDCDWNWGSDGGIVVSSSSQCVIQNCTVQRVAEAGIVQAQGGPNQILSNLIEEVALYGADTGNFDAWGSNGQGTEIAYNLCRDNQAVWGGGIYLDDNSTGFKVHDNVIQDMAWYGIIFKAGNTLYNNTSMQAAHQAILCIPSVGLAYSSWNLAGATVTNNQVSEGFPLEVALVNPSSIADYGYYGAYAYLSAGGRVEVDWSQFKQPWWAVQVPMALPAVNAIEFGLDCPAASYAYTIGHPRLLPLGGSGDSGAVSLAGAGFYAGGGCSTGGTSTAYATQVGPPNWGVTGTSAVGGWNELSLPLAAGTNLNSYRGMAFDLSGAAIRGYAVQRCVDTNNGPSAPGAALPIPAGANPADILNCQNAAAATPTVSPAFATPT